MAWKSISASPLLKALRGGKQGARRENAEEDRQAPRSGRTGGLGARAERPSDGNTRSNQQPPAEPGRKSRAPSAHGLRHQRG